MRICKLTHLYNNSANQVFHFEPPEFCLACFLDSGLFLVPRPPAPTASPSVAMTKRRPEDVEHLHLRQAELDNTSNCGSEPVVVRANDSGVK